MKILDWYIIKKFLGTFFYTVIIFTIVSVVINVSERIGYFIHKGLTAKQVLIEYYLHFMPWINGLLWPLFALISVIFFVSRMARDSEILSMLNAGMNFKRVLRPMILSASFIAALLWVGNNYVIPISTKKKVEFESEYFRRSNKRVLTNNLHWFISKNEKIFCRHYRTKDTTVQTFRLERYSEFGKLEAVFKARRLKFKSPPSTWEAEDYELRKIVDDKSFVSTHSRGKMDTVIALYPDDFVTHTKQMEMMLTSDLKKLITTEKSRGLGNTKKYEIELYRRSSDPFSVIILTLIGGCLASRKIRGGLGFHLAAGLGLGSVFVVISKFTVTFATNLNMHPVLGCWLPNIFFGVVCYYIYKWASA
ncbi:MAG: LptF/LptG family permease [Saprospiraceae bacterium]